MSITYQWDPKKFAECVRLMAQLKAVPIDKVMRNAGRDFTAGAYMKTGRAAVRSTPFLQVPNKAGGTYARAYEARQESNRRYHGSSIHPEGRHVLPMGMYIKGAMRWVRKTRVRNLGSRGGVTPNPPYPVAKGFARASWIGVFRGLGQPTEKPTENIPPAALKIGKVVKLADGVELLDRLSYMGRLDDKHGIITAGLQRAYETMDRELKREAKRMERLFA